MAKRKEEEDAKRKEEEDAKRKQQEAEEAKRKEEEAKRKQQETEDAKRKEEEEAKRNEERKKVREQRSAAAKRFQEFLERRQNRIVQCTPRNWLIRTSKQPRVVSKSFSLNADVPLSFMVRTLKTIRTPSPQSVVNTRRSTRNKSKEMVNCEPMHVNQTKWKHISGLKKALSRPFKGIEEITSFGKEHFTGPFSVQDAKMVCIIGLYMPDKVLYEFAKHFAVKSPEDNPLFVEDPSVVYSLLDLEKVEVNYEGS